MTHSRFRKKDSQSQEIDRTYRLLSDRYGVDLVELVYGKNGFMKTKYPNGFPDFKGDVVYSEKYWDEFERWLDKERGIILSDKYSEYADSKRRRTSKIDNAMKPQSNKIRKRDSEMITHKRRKRDGAGAGYHIFAIDYQILSGKIIGVTQIDNDTIKVKCDLNATADVWAEGYDTNSSTYEPQIKITEIVLENNMDDDFGNYGIIGEDGKYTGNEQAVYEFIKDSIGKIETKSLYGWGWSHVIYDGTLTTGESYKEFTVDDWYCYVSMIAKIVSLDVINDIDYEITNPYGEDEEPVEDSKPKKTRDDALYGVKGVEFYPSNYGGKVYYKGYEFDYFDVEDELFDSCKEEYGRAKAVDDDFFIDYFKKNVKSVLDEFISNGQYLDKGYPYEDSKHRKSHDSKPRYKTFIVKANSYKDAVEKVKRKLRK